MPHIITLVGAGTIGLSFAGLHLAHNQPADGGIAQLIIHDPRPDIEEHIYAALPGYLGRDASKQSVTALIVSQRLRIVSDLREAVQHSHIVQEQGPENVAFKQDIWPKIERYALPDCLFWSSTSGIPASVQSARMSSPSRLLVVHPYNPPHIMPLVEIVPSPVTDANVVSQTTDFWNNLGREPVVLKKEVTGFVANRLAFALLREAIHLVSEGVVSVRDLDRVVESSMGPRWAVVGPFKSYHMGGGAGGLQAFLNNIGGTVQSCWDDSGVENMDEGWKGKLVQETQDAYGSVQDADYKERDEVTMRVLEAAKKVH